MKHTILLFFGLVVIFLGMACQSEKPGSKKRVEELNPVPNATEIIRNPMTASGLKDTVNVAKMDFEETNFDFGTVFEGDKIEHSFTFKNTGTQPLIIQSARSTCGCTVPNHPRDPIQPGDTGVIDVVFNTKGKTEKQHKPITITANTFPSKTVLHLNGFVTPKK